MARCTPCCVGLVLVITYTALSASAGNDVISISPPYEPLERFIDNADCDALSLLRDKLTAPLKPHLVLLETGPTNQLLRQIELRQQRMSCSQSPQRRRRSSGCADGSIGDGWCDIACNVQDKRWDGGDCCPHTCGLSEKRFPCGSGGYQCIGDRKIPVWFASRTQLCYRWYPDGDGGQCGGGAARDLCAGVNSLTPVYRDDTDRRPGGCRMSWAIMTSALQIPDWFRKVAICFRWFPDGDGGQCGGGAPRETCANLNSYTAVYRDDTDKRPGGCQMSWKLSIPNDAAYWAQDIALCYQWYPDGDGGQCGGGADRKLCAVAGQWTSYYRDDTDRRGGGCRMQWGLVLA